MAVFVDIGAGFDPEPLERVGKKNGNGVKVGVLVGVKVEVGVKVSVNVAEGANVSVGRGVKVIVGLKVTVDVTDGVKVGEISNTDVIIAPPVFGMRTVEFRRSFSDPRKIRYGTPKPSKQIARITKVSITVKLLSFIPSFLLYVILPPSTIFSTQLFFIGLTKLSS